MTFWMLLHVWVLNPSWLFHLACTLQVHQNICHFNTYNHLICNALRRFSVPHWINQFKVIKRMTAASKDNLHLTPAPVPFNQSTDYRYWLSLLSIFVLTSLAVRSVLIPANDLQLNLCYVRTPFHLLRCCSLDNQSIKIDNKVWYLYVLLELKSIRSNLFTVVAVTTDRSAIINPEYFP